MVMRAARSFLAIAAIGVTLTHAPAPVAALATAASVSPAPTPSQPSAPAMTPTVSTAILPASVDACAPWLSDGDKAVGIAVATDASCVTGGVGCIGLQCRYCRARDTPQSHHFFECGSLSGSASSPQPQAQAQAQVQPQPAAPTPVPTLLSNGGGECASWSSSGNAAVGVSVFRDVACATGGVGCIGGTTCRYCRSKDSAQSSNFVTCPAAATASTVGAAEAACAKFSTSGDRAVGIQVASDASCANGGTGCIGQTCRSCRSADTSQSSHLLSCSTLPSGSMVVRVELQSMSGDTDGRRSGPSKIWLAATVVAGVAAAVAALVVIVAKRAARARWQNQALAAPMRIEQRPAPLADL